jgi:hypothetical protein
MKYKLIDYPQFVDRDIYQSAIDAIIDKLKRFHQVKTIYTIGHVGNPGISDIDMLVIAEDQAILSENFRLNMKSVEKYLFLHQPYGCSVTDFKQAEQYSFFHNYQLAYGNDLRTGISLNAIETDLLKKQTALEFLLKMLIQMLVQKTYGVLRIRDLLLHGKALIYDLEFLNITKGTLFDLVQSVIKWRNNWFTQRPSDKELTEWFEQLYSELYHFLKHDELLNSIYFPDQKTYRLSRNVFLISGTPSFEIIHKGWVLPLVNLIKSKKMVRLQNRFNTFTFKLPSNSNTIPDIIQQRFLFEHKTRIYGKKYLPNFLPLTSSLHLS